MVNATKGWCTAPLSSVVSTNNTFIASNRTTNKSRTKGGVQENKLYRRPQKYLKKKRWTREESDLTSQRGNPLLINSKSEHTHNTFHSKYHSANKDNAFHTLAGIHMDYIVYMIDSFHRPFFSRLRDAQKTLRNISACEFCLFYEENVILSEYLAPKQPNTSN